MRERKCNKKTILRKIAKDLSDAEKYYYFNNGYRIEIYSEHVVT